jgi:hypothetical protein
MNTPREQFTNAQITYGFDLAEMLLNPTPKSKAKFLESGKELVKAAQSIPESERLKMLSRDGRLWG